MNRLSAASWPQPGVVARPCGRGERGSGTLLASLVVAVTVGLTGAAVVFGVGAAEAQRVEGAADLAAIAGADAQLAGGDACAGARASAAANRVEITACELAGDEVEFVVAVRVEATQTIGVWQRRWAGRANAGVLTGAPE